MTLTGWSSSPGGGAWPGVAVALMGVTAMGEGAEGEAALGRAIGGGPETEQYCHHFVAVDYIFHFMFFFVKEWPKL